MGYPKGMWVIQNWSVTIHPDLGPWTDPACNKSIQGNCDRGHPELGDFITTSPIVKIVGRRVTTAKGSRYVLGKPEAEFVAWCRANGHHVPTRKHPIKIGQRQVSN
jgi:hypothetical protein